MTFDQALAVVSVVGGIAASAITNLRGYRRVDYKLEGVYAKLKDVSDRLKNYVTVDEYRSKISGLHEEINKLKVENAALKRDVAHLLGSK